MGEIDRDLVIQLGRRLDGLKSRMVRNYPFFGQLVMQLRLSVASCGTACTDMERIIFDPRFCGRLSDDELTFILMHEVMHCVLKHPLRGKGKLHHLYNVACDIVVNSCILESIGQNEFMVDGEYAMHLSPSGKEGRDMTADEVYQEFLAGNLSVPVKKSRGKSGKQRSGNESEGTSGEPDGESGNEPDNEAGKSAEETPGKPSDRSSDEASEKDSKGAGSGDDGYERVSVEDLVLMDLHEIWDQLDISEVQDKEWDEKLRRALANCPNQGTEDVPSVVRKLLEKEEAEARIRWTEVLRDFVQETVTYTDYSFAPPDRRFSDSDLLLPGENDQSEENIQNIWFCIDTSGSMSDELLSAFFHEVRNITRQVRECECRVSFFDTKITEPIPFREERDFQEIRPIGGGGTDFSVVFSYMGERMREDLPRAVVILSDGYAFDPPESMALGVPVLWIICGNHEERSWGRTIFIEEGEWE